MTRCFGSLTGLLLLLPTLATPLHAQPLGRAVAWGSFRIVDPALTEHLADVSAGYRGNLGLCEDGSLVEWGEVSFGELPVPNSGFTAVSRGLTHCLALREDGSIEAWGYNQQGQCEVPEPNSGFVAVSTGSGWWSGYSVGLKADGSLRAWGHEYDLPEPNTGFVDIAATGSGGFALKADGQLVGWGAESVVPEPDGVFLDVATGPNHHLALRDDGSILAWGGINASGECDVPEPNSDFVAVSAGATWTEDWAYSLGLKSDGTVVAWGYHDSVPESGTGYVAISAGFEHALAVEADGALACLFGDCGLTQSNSDLLAVSASQRGGANQDCMLLGLASDGSVVKFHGSFQCESELPCTAVQSAGLHALGLHADGSVSHWGLDRDGLASIPEPNQGYVDLAGYSWYNPPEPGGPGGYLGGYSLGLRSDGSVESWGNGSLGDVPEPNTGFLSIESSINHALGVKEDGSVVAWGWNSWGQCDVPSPNEDFVAVATGYGHSLGLKTNGSISAWGWNSDDQCEVPLPNEDFVAIAAGERSSLGLKADGTLVAWGDDSEGQCRIPEPNSNFIAISASGTVCLALRSDGVVVEGPSAASGRPATLEILSLRPNPFNPSTTLVFETRRAGPVTLSVHDLAGRLVARRDLGALGAGRHRASWNGIDGSGRNAASGFYVLQLVDGAGTARSAKALLLR